MLCVRYRQYTFIKKSVSEHREIHGVGKTLIMLIQMFNSSGNWSRFYAQLPDVWRIYGIDRQFMAVHSILWHSHCDALIDF